MTVMNIRSLTYNLLKLLTVAILLPQATACSWVVDDYDVEDPSMDILSRFDAEGKAWLNLEIPLGYLTGVTRSTEYDDPKFVDGNEHAVHDLTIVLLHGTSEDDAKVASSYYFSETEWVDDNDPQVTKTLQVTSDNIERGDNVYLLTILNHIPTLYNNMPYSDIKNSSIDITNEYNSTDYFVMANAPLATDNEGSGTVNTLVKVDPLLFFATESEAENYPAAYVYVERAAAKVSVELGNIPTITNDSYTDYYIKGNPNLVFTNQHISDYSIYNYNAQSYLVRHFEADNNTENWLSLNRNGDYRFIESTALPYGSARYRTYWAKDENYDANIHDNLSDGQSKAFKEWKAIKTKESGSTGKSDYCAENTMDLAHMNIRNSTLVLVRLNLNNYISFYTTSVTGSDVIYQLPTNPQEEEGTSAHESFARQKDATTRSATPIDKTNHYYVSSARTIDEYLREWLMQTNSDARNWVNTYAAGDANRIIIKLDDGQASNPRKSGPKDGGQAVVHCTQIARTSGDGVSGFTALDLDNYFANNITVNYYDHGYCYYLVPVRHFVDDETPWQSAPSMTGSSASAAYGSDNNAYLGRFGVVRNNWYTISITGVTHVGGCNAWQLYSQMSDQADDTVEQLLNAKLVINPWNTESSTLIIPTPTPEP